MATVATALLPTVNVGETDIGRINSLSPASDLAAPPIAPGNRGPLAPASYRMLRHLVEVRHNVARVLGGI